VLGIPLESWLAILLGVVVVGMTYAIVRRI
jgi:hypothetical protein